MITDPPDLSHASALELPAVLANWLSALPADELPARLCCSRGGLIDPDDWSFSVLGVRDRDDCVSARVGFFFTEVVGGCNCNDDPSRFNDYCELIIEIMGAERTFRWRDLGTEIR